jgi:hypothetical protein
MIKMKIDELVYEVKEEMLCYEELGKKKADEWEQGFKKWLSGNKKKKNVVQKNDNLYYCIEDESAIFDIADEYLEAVENNSENEYWSKFQ